jgi:hypothetical protein
MKKSAWKEQEMPKPARGQFSARRFYRTGGVTLQLGKYRGQDEFDKYMKQKYAWHGKYYVNIWGSGKDKEKLFATKKEAEEFAKRKMGR